jgi:pilus assembly protein Flp/PilA
MKSQTEIRALIIAFLESEAGATANEYGLIAMGIAIVIAAAVIALGSKFDGTFF